MIKNNDKLQNYKKANSRCMNLEKGFSVYLTKRDVMNIWYVFC